MSVNSWGALKELRAQDRKSDAERLAQKGFELMQDDIDAASRHFNFALYQVERLFCLRKGFKL